MSLSATIAFHARPANIPHVARLLLERLAPPNDRITVHLYTGDPGHRKRLEDTNLISRIEDLVEQIVPSMNAISIDFPFPLNQIDTSGMTIYCCGIGYDMGWKARYDDQLRASMRLNDIIPAGPSRKPALKDAEDLFRLAISLAADDSTDPIIDHAGMYQETGWKSPVGCGLVYHRDLEDFAFDFIRIWADYHMAVYMPSVYRLEDERLRNKHDLIHTLGNPEQYHEASYITYKNEYDDHKWMYTDIKDFLELLDYETAVRLYRETRGTIREELRQVCAKLVEVKFEDLGPLGGMLVADPRLPYQDVYRMIAARYGVSAEL